jgi:hypothetical protein
LPGDAPAATRSRFKTPGRLHRQVPGAFGAVAFHLALVPKRHSGSLMAVSTSADARSAVGSQDKRASVLLCRRWGTLELTAAQRRDHVRTPGADQRTATRPDRAGSDANPKLKICVGRKTNEEPVLRAPFTATLATAGDCFGRTRSVGWQPEVVALRGEQQRAEAALAFASSSSCAEADSAGCTLASATAWFVPRRRLFRSRCQPGGAAARPRFGVSRCSAQTASCARPRAASKGIARRSGHPRFRCAGVRAPPARGFVCLARSEMDVSARVTNLIRPPHFSSSICG